MANFAVLVNPHAILPILYDLAITIGEHTSVQPLLTRVLQRLLYHTSYPAGLIFLDRPQQDSSNGDLIIQVDMAVGDYDLVKSIGSSIAIPGELLETAPTDPKKQADILARWRLIEGRYRNHLFLPLGERGGVILIAPWQPVTPLPLQEMFRTILSHLAHAIVLCRRSDAQISQLASDRTLYAEVFESSSLGVMATTPDGYVVAVNPAFTRITGYTAHEMIGTRPSKLSSGRHDPAFFRELWHTIREQGYWQGEIWNRRRDGEAYPEWLSISPVRNSEGQLTYYVGIFSDLSKEKEIESLKHRVSFLDPLTELPNRRLLLDRVSQACAAAEREGSYGAVISIDIDGFGSINDGKGHHTGDLLLKAIAKRLAADVPAGDTVSRIGGDEFVVLARSLGSDPKTAATRAEQIAEDIQRRLSAPYSLSSLSLQVAASIGIAIFSARDTGVDDLLRRADIATTQAKRAGGNVIRFFDPVMQEQVDARIALIDGLRDAARLEQLSLHLQPQFNSKEMLTGAEVLLRWTHPRLGMVSPALFIPVAEESGLIVALGHWVLNRACQILATWSKTPHLNTLSLAVNVSSRQFVQDDFVSCVQQAIEKWGVDPTLLKLELTESAMVENVEEVICKMTSLKALGLQISLDDFGTGYSSLQYLTRLPLDQIKIDQSFVRDLDREASYGAVVKTIVGMAKSMGLQIIAEGVENRTQKDILMGYGCHHFQGYHFSPPLSEPQFDHFVRARTA